MVSRVGKLLERVAGFVNGDGVKDSSAYLDNHTFVVDVQGRDAGSPAFLLRALGPGNAPLEVFRIDKDGNTTATALQGAVWAASYGLLEGATDNGPAINAAIAAAQAAGRRTVVLGPGRFRYSTKITLTGANLGIALVGSPVPATMQAGSTNPSCALEWTGGAEAAIDVTTSFCSFYDLSIYNTGTGTAAMHFHPNGHAELHRVSFAGPSGSSAWSTAAIHSEGGLNYSRIVFCHFDVSPAIKMTGVHTMLTVESCVFDAIGAGPMIDADELAGDNVHFRACTWNSTALAPTFWDNSGTTTTLNNLTFEDCEFDCSAGAYQSAIAKIKNVFNVAFRHCEVSSFGNGANTAALVQLTNVARCWVEGCNLNSVNPYLVDCLDAVSRVFQGANRCALDNTVGILDPSGAVPGNVVQVTPGSAVAGTARLHGDLVSPQSPAIFVVNVANNTAFSLEIPGPTDGVDPGWMAPGQVFTVRIKNASGGVMGAVTFGSMFNTAGAFTVPANGFSRSITFYGDGADAHELWRGAADVAN